MKKFGLVPKRLFFDEFSKTLGNREIYYYSFNEGVEPLKEVDLYFNRIIENHGNRHVPVYRLCDAEYMYTMGVKVPRFKMSLKTRLGIIGRGLLVRFNLMNQRTWHGENYSATEKRRLKRKYINDLQQIAKDGFLAPHLLLSEGKFCEEYNEPMVKYFHRHTIPFHKDNFFPFYFVYVILSLKKYKEKLFNGKNVLVLTSFNERKRKESFEAEFRKEGVANIYYYEISATKSMMEIIDPSKLPAKVDLVLIGAGIGSANILNQIKHLKAICIDAGHALDCFSSPQLRQERVCLYPDEMINETATA